MRNINKIIIHCSDSTFGDAEIIDAWHRSRGWKGIGYHWVIVGGVIKSEQPYDPDMDGLVQTGRPVDTPGAHCLGENMDSIGICLIGKHHFTGMQLYYALPNLLRLLMNTYRLRYENIYGHRDFNDHKTCPNIDTQLIRRIARWT